MYLHQMLALFLPPFLLAWGLLMAILVIHVGWVNATWKVWEWPTALYFVAISDQKTRNDFWHMVVNSFILAVFIVLTLFALGKLHHV